MAAAGLALAPLALAGPASAQIVHRVVFFSNADYTNVGVNDANQISALESSGITVTVFDGGDGSAEAWSAAIEGMQGVVIPYSGNIYDTPVLSVAAAQVLQNYVSNGGTILLTTELQPELLSYLTGVDFTSVWWTVGSAGDTWPYVLPDPAFPAELAYTDAINAVDTSNWNDEQLNAVLPVYYSDDTVTAAVLAFGVGSGNIYTVGYDWYPGTEGSDAANRAAWNTVQGLLIPEAVESEPSLESPAPGKELAATGAPVAFVAGAAAVVLASGIVTIVVSRRRARV